MSGAQVAGTAWAIVLAVVCMPAAASPDGASPVACLGAPEAAQQLRDNLETASTYLKSTKDNFGADRGKAIDGTSSAIEAFARLQAGPAIEPAASTRVAQYLGEHGHPKMTRAWTALDAANTALNSAACLAEPRLAELRRRVGQALDYVNGAFVFNPPWSRH